MGGFTASNEIISNILAGLKQHQERVLGQQQLAQEQQHNVAEQQARQQQLDIAKKGLEEEVKQHTIQNAAELAAHKFAVAQATQQMAQTYQQTGAAPAGATIAPAPGSAPSGAPTIENYNAALNSGQQVMTIPGAGADGKDLQIPTISPQKATEISAAKAEALAGPARKTEEEKLQIQQAEETKRQLLTGAQNAQFEKERLAMTIAGENERNRLTTSTQMAVAQLPYAMFQQMDPKQRDGIVSNYTNALYGGSMSAKDVLGDTNTKGLTGAAGAILLNFAKEGGVPLNDKQIAYFQNIKPAIDQVPNIAAYIQALPKTTGKGAALFSGMKNMELLNPNLEAQKDTIHSQIANVAKSIGGDAGQRLQRALLAPAEGGYLPNKYDPTSANVLRYNAFIDEINKIVDLQLGNVPPEQRAFIKANTLGMGNLKKLNPDATPFDLKQQSTAPAPSVSPGVAQTQSNPATSGVRHLMYNPNGPATPIQ